MPQPFHVYLVFLRKKGAYSKCCRIISPSSRGIEIKENIEENGYLVVIGPGALDDRPMKIPEVAIGLGWIDLGCCRCLVVFMISGAE
jgi:hypothetical protein